MSKLTRKDVTKMYNKAYRVGYGDLYYILERCKKVGYNCGIYGWNWSCYELDDDTCIITGYRNTIGESIENNIVKKYNELSEKTLKNNNWEERQKQMKKVIEKFKKEVCNK